MPVKRILTSKNLTPGARKALGNTTWLMAERVLRIGISLFVGVWMARYLGPERFGIFNYAIAFVALFAPLATLGVEGIAVRDIVRRNESVEETLGSSFILRLVGGAVALAAVLMASRVTHADEPLTRYLIAILGVGLIFRAFETIDFWFQAQVESKYSVYAKSTALLAAAGAKVGLILMHASVAAFAFVLTGEAAAGALSLVGVYFLRRYSLRTWRVTFARVKALLTESWPLILSGIGVSMNLSIDKIMLGRMSGATEVGVYSAAVRLSETWYFIPLAVASSVFPALVRSKDRDRKIYNDRLQRLYDLMIWLALAVAIPVSLAARPLVGVLYGAQYQGASTILTVHVWACLFAFMGAALSKWLINEGLLKFSLARHTLGATANVGLNLFLIPRYGGLGAAVATLVSYSTSNWLACFIFPTTRSAGKMMARALVVPVRTVLALGRRAMS